MAFTGQTPESLLDRSDSKNPATTCKGITKLGRPCRNPLDLEAIRNASGDNGVLAVTSVVGDSDDDEEIGAAAFFCWRHKDQAEQLVNANASGNGPQRQDTQLFPLKNRSSIDTLVARLGVLEVDDSAPQTQAERRKRREQRRREGGGSSSRPPRRVNRPPTWDRVQGPLISVPSDVMKQQRLGQNRPQKKKQSLWSSLCCGSADDDYVEVVRHKKRVSQQQYSSEKPTHEPPRVPRPQNGRLSNSRLPATTTPPRKPLNDNPGRPANKKRPSETSTLLSYIPTSLPPQTAAALLAELTKPISPHDDPGYIYIFWLTEESLGPAPSSTASSLLAPPARPEQARRTSDVLRQYSVRSPNRPNRPRRRSNVNTSTAPDETEDEKKTILLKIGRANNVHRRMNEWTRQCGYSLSLVRFYPYVSSTPQPSPSPSPHASPAHSRRPSNQGISSSSNPTLDTRPPNPHRGSSGVRKVPHAHRVERLIHLELGEKRVMKQCEACGKEHREWFEVEASRDGVKGVDEVVRRWVDWAERAGNDS